MKLKQYIALVICIGSSFALFAQQNAGNTQFLWNQLAFNPAVAGSKDGLSSGLFYRNQWTGFEGAPRTENAFLHAPLSHGSFGVGLNVMRDRLGFTSTSAVQASFAYQLGMQNGTLSFGLSAEYGNTHIDWTQANPSTAGDQSIPVANIGEAFYNFGFGTYFRNERFFVGLSAPRLLETRSLFANTDNVQSASYQTKRHVHLTGGALFRISQNTYLHPITMLRYVDGAPLQADLGVLFYVNKSIWVGPSYRLGDSFSAIFSYEITKSLKVGYAYDFTITKIQNHLGSHELYLGFNFIKKSDGYYHPRFF